MSNERKQKELDNGWTIEAGDVYRFRHVSPEWAEEKRAGLTDGLYAVDVIQSVVSDDGSYHLNTFFAWGYTDALAEAAYIQAAPYPDDVIAIRPATAEEVARFFALYDHFHYARQTPAVSEEQAAALASRRDEGE